MVSRSCPGQLSWSVTSWTLLDTLLGGVTRWMTRSAEKG